jgi:uncharacterized protein (DUF1015 family)
VVEDGSLGRACRSAVVMRPDRVQELGTNRGFERRGALFDQAQAEMHVSEQASLLGRAKDRPAGELDRASDVMKERSGQQEVGAQPRMKLRDLPADRRHADGVLEQPSGIAVVPLDGRRKRAKPATQLVVVEEAADRGFQAGVRDLAGEELEEAVELGGVAAHCGRERGRVEVFSGLERTHLELQPVSETVDSAEDPDGVTFGEAAVQEVDVGPDSGFDPPAGVDELECQVRSAAARPQALLLGDRVHALDDPVVLELRDRRHAPSLGSETDVSCAFRPGAHAMLRSGSMAELKPFRALRYDVDRAGPLESLVAPPYDVIGPAQRDDFLARSPHNVVHLTLPDSEEAAGRSFREWREEGIIVPEEPGFWALSQDYVGPDGVPRTRTGLVGSLRVEPYESGNVLPHERTHRGPIEGRLRLLREVRAQLEPIFLLYEGPAPFETPDRPPGLEVEGTRLWRLPDEKLGSAFADQRLLIADGHHRYETALAYHQETRTPESGYMMVVLVSLEDPGLTIFPTHRIFRGSPEGDLLMGDPRPDPESAVRELGELPRERAAVVVYDGTTELAVDGAGELDVQLVDRLGHEGLSYTADWREAVRAVDEGEATLAVLMRPTRIEDVFQVAARGETMPQKSTYFYPKLVSGLLLHPLES